MAYPDVPFSEILKPNKRSYTLGPVEDANLVGMRLYGLGPFHRELKPAHKIRKKTHFLIRENDVIYNKLFAWKGTFGIVPHELDGMFVSDKFPTYELDESKVHRGYLRWYFRYAALWEQARRMSKGSAALSKLTLNPPRFMDLAIPLPTLTVQRSITKKIDRLADRINGASTVRAKAQPQPDCLFFSRMDQVMRQASNEFPTATLLALVDPDRGISYGVVQTGTLYPGGVPTLRAGNLQQFHIVQSNIKTVDPAIEAKYGRTRLRGGELLLRIRGGLGEVAVCPPRLVGGNVSREIAVMPFLETINPRYAMFAVAAPSSQDFLKKHIRGTSYLGINLRDVRRLEIPVPPLKEQHRIVEYLSAIQSKVHQVKELHAKTAIELDALLPSILDKAFKGEL